MPTDLLDEPKTRAVARHGFGRRTFKSWISRRLMNLVILATLAACGFTGWYLARKGFGREWRRRVTEELRKHGVEASVRRLTLDPFRGLVAQDVRIYDYRNRENTIAVISQLSLDINYAALLHHQSFLNAVDVRNAELTIPLPASATGAARAELHQFRAHIYFPPDRIEVSQAEGLFCGIRIAATGQLIKRADYKSSPDLSEEEWLRRMQLLQMTVTELNRFRFGGVPPRLQLKFSGDVSRLEEAHVEATLQGEHAQRAGYEMKTVAVQAEWSDQELRLTHCAWTDDAGKFTGASRWRRSDNTADFQAQSTIDLKQFLASFGFGKLLADINFTAPPTLEFSGSVQLAGEAPKFQVIGRGTLGAFAMKEVSFLSLASEFSWDANRTMIRGLRLRHETGELAADLFEAPNDFRLNLESTLNPAVFASTLSTELRKFLQEWEWPRPPVVRLAIRGASRDPGTWRGDGTIATQRTRFRGVWMNSGSAKIHFGEGAITFADLRVVRDEGTGIGSFTYDFRKHEVRLANVHTTLRPADAIYWIDPKLLKAVTPYRFRQPPRLTANGVVQFRGGKGDHLQIDVEAPAGLSYTFLGKTLPIERVSTRLLFTNDRLQINDLSAGLFGGDLRGEADISLAKGDPRYRSKIEVDGIDFPRLTELYFKFKSAEGRLKGTYDFTGRGDDARSMRGEGKVQVRDGDVFAIPVFGPLSGVLASIFPGSGYSIAHQATSTFAIRDGVIHTDDFNVSGKLFGMVGHGDVFFLDDKLDFDVRINTSGAGIVLAPVYKLFEYKGEGSLTKPTWRPKRF